MTSQKNSIEVEKRVRVPTLTRELVRFTIREDRPAFIGHRFHNYLTGKVLDLGCDRAVLKEILDPDRYVGVGMTQDSDVKVNLEQEGPLPFGDASWDTVICLDTLEHLNNLHAFCNEIFRIAREYVIISLPNCWVQARRALARGTGPIWQYGLTVKPPEDRHKWFFNTEEACTFFVGQLKERESGIEIAEFVVLENRRPLLNRIWRHLKYPSFRKYLNLYPHTIVCVYRLPAKCPGNL